jgi:hypothetical protein
MKTSVARNEVVDYMVANQIELSVDNYIALAYLGDYTASTVEEELPEDWAEIETLIDEGILRKGR